MYSTLLLSTLFATALTAPLAQTTTQSDWTPAAGSIATCDKISAYTIGGSQGILLDTLLTNACAAMMPCGFPNRPADLVCAETINISLNKEKTTTQPANILYQGNKQSGWSAKFTVTPLVRQGSADARWTKEECIGYFAHILDTSEPEGCHNSQGMGIGSITVGGESSLKGAVFKVTVVKRQ